MSRKLRELAVKVERPPQEPQVDQLGRAAAVGGRKTSVARVRAPSRVGLLGSRQLVGVDGVLGCRLCRHA